MHVVLLLVAYNTFDIMTRCHPHVFVKMPGEVGCIASMHILIVSCLFLVRAPCQM